MVERLQPRRDPSHNPLTQVMLVLLNAPAEELVKPQELEIAPEWIAGNATQLDLTLFVKETEGRRLASVTYNSDFFERTTIERMMRSFVGLLSAASERPECRIGELPLMSLVEQEQIVVVWNRSEQGFLGPHCLHERIEEQVRRQGGAVAVIDGEQELSYEGLNRRANRLANHLRAEGVGVGSIVAVCVERSLEMVVAILGVLKAGGAYTPLDPAYPRERLERMLRDAGKAESVVDAERIERRAGRLCGPANRAGPGEFFEEQSPDNPESGVSSEDLAYVVVHIGFGGSAQRDRDTAWGSGQQDKQI